MIWGNFLHIYQPPDQKKDTLKQIAQESYRKLVRIIKDNPSAKLTLNISACLSEQLLLCGCRDIIEGLKELMEKGQIEFTDSAKYHAFLPLLPEEEIERQIILNRQTNRKIFGKNYRPVGFHIPEMAYSKKVAKIVAEFGYKWIILNEVSYHGKLFSEMDTSKIYRIKEVPGLKVLFRDRRISDMVQRGQVWETEEFYSAAERGIKENEYLVTAMDGETFGHHRPGLEKFLEKVFLEKKIKTLTISEIVASFTDGEEISPIEGTWASMESEIKAKIPYAQWNYPGNPIHKRQWELTRMAIKEVSSRKKDKNYAKARKMLDKALFSCQYWWAGAVPWWEVEYIEKGAYFLKTSIILLKGAPQKIKQRAEKLYSEIVFTAFDWERGDLAHKKAMAYTKRIIKELGGEMSGVSSIHSKK
jgi:predicted glycosyl hydrolase (DUF1957 family)